MLRMGIVGRSQEKKSSAGMLSYLMECRSLFLSLSLKETHTWQKKMSLASSSSSSSKVPTKRAETFRRDKQKGEELSHGRWKAAALADGSCRLRVERRAISFPSRARSACESVAGVRIERDDDPLYYTFSFIYIRFFEHFFPCLSISLLHKCVRNEIRGRYAINSNPIFFAFSRIGGADIQQRSIIWTLFISFF